MAAEPMRVLMVSADVVGYRGTWDIVHGQGVHTAVPVLAMPAAGRDVKPGRS